jgi:hypothetical protein
MRTSSEFATDDLSCIPGAPRGYRRRSPGYFPPRACVTTEDLQARARLGDADAQRRLDAIFDYVTRSGWENAAS